MKNQSLTEIINSQISRRKFLQGTASVGLASFVGASLTSCGGGGSSSTSKLSLNFEAISANDTDNVSIPDGYNAKILYATGDPQNSADAAYSNSGSESGSDFANRCGDYNDGMHFFGIDGSNNYDPASIDRGLLCINHESTTNFLHSNNPTCNIDSTRADQVRKELNAVGVSVVEVKKVNDEWQTVQDSSFNRRINLTTPVDIVGQASGSTLLQTKFSNTGVAGRGTSSNCANGWTPWGTYLTCEENFDSDFHDSRGSTIAEVGMDKFIVGIKDQSSDNCHYHKLAGIVGEANDEFGRFDNTPSGGSATTDYRNEPNQFGYVVEIDPFNPSSTPKKRTSMGRFKHEGCWPANVKVGEPMVFYMGDDENLQYIYKFVSQTTWQGEGAGQTGDDFLDNGTLYVARFDSDNTGVWLPLTTSNTDLINANASGQFAGLFATQDSIIVHTRAAAFAVGATPMDRPEWGAVNPLNGEVYFTLTNFYRRSGSVLADGIDEITEILGNREYPTDSANPRNPNGGGHIIRFKENNNQANATTFEWDIFVFGYNVSGTGLNLEGNADTNPSNLTDDNNFSFCDGLYFDSSGILWIQTDGTTNSQLNGPQFGNNNNQMIAVLPGSVGDGGVDTTKMKRFLVGPKGCEITGISMSYDRKTLFVNVQHPGNDDNLDVNNPATYVSGWPNGTDATTIGASNTRSRSATIVITRDGGGEIGAENS